MRTWAAWGGAGGGIITDGGLQRTGSGLPMALASSPGDATRAQGAPLLHGPLRSVCRADWGFVACGACQPPFPERMEGRDALGPQTFPAAVAFPQLRLSASESFGSALPSPARLSSPGTPSKFPLFHLLSGFLSSEGPPNCSSPRGRFPQPHPLHSALPALPALSRGWALPGA